MEATGELVDDPNVTDKRLPGNPTLSYRTREPLRVLGEAIDWAGHPADIVAQRKRDLAQMQGDGTGVIID
nr:NAD(+)--rifampin ADP-ribosyltransferase [Sphingomonas sp.]